MITEVFNLDGELIAESDRFTYSIEGIFDFLKYRFPEKEKEVIEWANDYFLNQPK